MELAQIEKKLKKKVKEIFLKTVPRYYDHTLKVVANMKRIAKKIDDPEDKTILLLAAYLHDIGYSVPYRGDYVGNINRQALKIRLHSEVGAKVAKEILKTMEIEPEVARKVSYLISVHHRQHIEDRHLKMLLQADKV
ncbi:MAG: HD domain-containing protein [Candidatus Binatia bacterium]